MLVWSEKEEEQTSDAQVIRCNLLFLESFFTEHFIMGASRW